MLRKFSNNLLEFLKGSKRVGGISVPNALLPRIEALLQVDLLGLANDSLRYKRLAVLLRYHQILKDCQPELNHITAMVNGQSLIAKKNYSIATERVHQIQRAVSVFEAENHSALNDTRLRLKEEQEKSEHLYRQHLVESNKLQSLQEVRRILQNRIDKVVVLQGDLEILFEWLSVAGISTYQQSLETLKKGNNEHLVEMTANILMVVYLASAESEMTIRSLKASDRDRSSLTNETSLSNEKEKQYLNHLHTLSHKMHISSASTINISTQSDDEAFSDRMTMAEIALTDKSTALLYLSRQEIVDMRVRIFDYCMQYLSYNDVKDLYFLLKIDWNDLIGEMASKTDKIRELIIYLESSSEGLLNLIKAIVKLYQQKDPAKQQH